MGERTKEALEGSIRKWRNIVDGGGGDSGTLNCPLCQLFNGDNVEISCGGCPVADKVEVTGCEDTPYRKWSDLQLLPYPFYADTPKRLEAAKAELEFLESLRDTNS